MGEVLALRPDLAPIEGELVKAKACNFIGCENEALRSDGKCSRHSLYRVSPKSAIAEAEEILKQSAPEAAHLALMAARIGAAQGDHKGAAFILERSGAARPQAPAPAVTVVGEKNFVYIGRVLPGLPGAEDDD